jgi:hypothetical protein
VIVVGGAKGSYQLNVADVPAHTRGVAVLLGPSRDVVVPLTAAIREGQRSFVLSMEAAPPSPNPIGPAAVAAATVASPVATMTNLVVAPSQPALPPSSGESGAAHGTGALASSPSSTDFLLEDGTGGGGMVLPEGQDREGGGPARAPEKQGGNPPEPGSLLEWLQDLWEMLRSLLPVPRLNRP